MLTTLRLVLVALILAGCEVRGAIPSDAAHPLLWFVGLSAGVCLLSASAAMLGGLLRRHERRDERRDRRDERGPGPK